MDIVTLQLQNINSRNLNKISVVEQRNLRLVIPRLNYNSQSSSQKAFDFLLALYIGESIAPFCEKIIAIEDPKEYPFSVCFDFQPKDWEELSKILTWIAKEFKRDLKRDFEDFENSDLTEAAYDFAGLIETQKLHFPELADTYLLNAIEGEEWFENLEKEDQYPEQQHNYILSFLSKELGYDFYVSAFGWIVPLNIDLEYLLKRYGVYEENFPSLLMANYEGLVESYQTFASGIKKSTLPLLKTEFLSQVQNEKIVLISNGKTMVGFEIGLLSEARDCADEIIDKKPFGDLAKQSQLISQEDGNISIVDIGDSFNDSFNYLLSENGELLVIRDKKAQYLLLGNRLYEAPPKILEQL